MSSPVTAFRSCSRLSPYIAFGVISVKEVLLELIFSKLKPVDKNTLKPNVAIIFFILNIYLNYFTFF